MVQCVVKLRIAHLFIELEPCRETLRVLVLESKVPNLPQPDGLNDLKYKRKCYLYMFQYFWEQLKKVKEQIWLQLKFPSLQSGNYKMMKVKSKMSKSQTWSKSCFPVVLGWMANSSSASIVVTLTLI